MKLSRTHLAAAGTAVALGTLAAVALGASGGEPAAQVEAVPGPPPVEIRTVVERRTVREVRRETPRGPASEAAAPAPSSAPPPAAEVVRASQPAPAPASEPLRSSTSGASDDDEHEDRHEREDDEHEDEDEDGDD
jgi:hypothetical protein